MKLVTIKLFLLISFNNIFSQTDSLEFMLNFYPLEIGNYWEYEEIIKPYNPDTAFYSVTVKKDTTLNNGHKYYILENKSLQSGKILETRYERVDSITSRVYKYEGNYDYIIDSLMGVLSSYEVDLDTTNYYEPLAWSSEIYADTLLEYPTYKKHVPAPIGIIDRNFELAFGLGVTYKYGGFVPDVYRTNLLFARINGIEYGNQVTDIKEEITIPNKAVIYQNYPNPFNPKTTIDYSIPEASFVTLKIFDVLGREIITLINEEQAIGNYKIDFYANEFSSGIYFYQIKTKNYMETKKMLLLK